MRRDSTILLLLLLVTGVKAQITNSGNNITNTLPEKFQKKLSESKMVFTKPNGTSEVPIVENTDMHYDYALKLNDKNIEVRYSIWPIYKAMIDIYNNRQKSPGDTVLEPNKLHKQFALFAFSKISGGKISPNQVRLQPFTVPTVKKDFNADEGTMSMGPVGEAFSPKYTFGFYMMIHKDNAGDGYILYLFESQDAMFEEYKSITGNDNLSTALKFN
ncbi:MAG: hypothetical protein JWR38_497 [Mucilaginibacter sp.]|nr:hypothetical protein [Mucilaginibacter sp.]